MSDSIIDTAREHGQIMRRLALKHSLTMAKLYRDYGEDPINQLIAHLETKIASEEAENMVNHDRFDDEHRDKCDACRDAYADFIQEEIENAKGGQNDEKSNEN